MSEMLWNIPVVLRTTSENLCIHTVLLQNFAMPLLDTKRDLWKTPLAGSVATSLFQDKFLMETTESLTKSYLISAEMKLIRSITSIRFLLMYSMIKKRNQ